MGDDCGTGHDHSRNAVAESDLEVIVAPVGGGFLPLPLLLVAGLPAVLDLGQQLPNTLYLSLGPQVQSASATRDELGRRYLSGRNTG